MIRNKDSKDRVMYEILSLFPFTNQCAWKYKQSRNYRQTMFIYLSFIRKYNWNYWRKHSAVSTQYHVDNIAYSNNDNVIFLLQMLESTNAIILYKFFNIRFNRYILVISTEESQNYSLHKLWPSSNFYEREVSEMFGIKYLNAGDSRRLLLDYNDYSNPLKKDYDVFGSTELRYTSVTEKPMFVPNTLFNI